MISDYIRSVEWLNDNEREGLVCKVYTGFMKMLNSISLYTRFTQGL
jgi:hypothetical protein